MKKKEIIKNKYKHLLANNLSSVITRQQNNFIRNVNANLMILFWQMGKHLNEYLREHQCVEKNKQFFFNDISSLLVTKYGTIFNQKNLNDITKFSVFFSDLATVQQFTHFISWEHMYLLLQLEEYDTRQFYLLLQIEEGLSIIELKNKIAANFHKIEQNKKVQKIWESLYKVKRNANSFKVNQNGLKILIEKNPEMNTFFKETFLSGFQILLASLNKHYTHSIQIDKKNGIEEKWLNELFILIEKYAYQQNRWLNANLNWLFWEMGKQINREINLQGKIVDKDFIIQNAAIQLQKKYGKCFNEKQLHAMSIFAEIFKELQNVQSITYLLNWEYILILLPLRDIEAILFYASLTITKNLSKSALRNQIANNAYQQTLEAKEMVQNLLLRIQTRDVKTAIQKKGHSIASITTIEQLFNVKNEQLFLTNIFKNQYFKNFVTTF